MYHEKEKMIGNEQDQKIKMLTGFLFVFVSQLVGMTQEKLVSQSLTN